jgi:predicted nucleotide-binding protein
MRRRNQRSETIPMPTGRNATWPETKGRPWNTTEALKISRPTFRGCGFTITSIDETEHGHQIRTSEGAIVNWFPSSGTISVQGKAAPKRRLEEAWTQYTRSGQAEVSGVATEPGRLAAPIAPSNPRAANQKVFVVHGHDQQSREQLESRGRQMTSSPAPVE